jgi:hypothetical protein
MRAPHRTLLALASLALLPLAACKDSNGPDRRLVGEAHFTYSGTVNGEFDAEGRVTMANFETGTFAFAQRGHDRGNEMVIIYAQEGRSDSDKYDGLLLALEKPAVGTVTCVESTPDCPFFASFVLGQDDTSTAEPESMFFGTSGQVTVTEIDDGRVRGTFSFSMAGLLGDSDGEVEVRNGTFDLPLMDEDDAPFSRAEFGRLAP